MNTRRSFLTAVAAPLAVSLAPRGIAAAPPRTRMGVATTCFMTVRRPKDTYEFLDYCNALGAGGIQSSLTNQTPEYLRKVRTQAEKYGMFIEVMGGLPRSENDEAFANTMRAAKEIGAVCVRSACLGGRRYETFHSMDDWKNFVSKSQAALRHGVAIAEKTKTPWAVENHKDWTVDEFTAILKQYSSEYFGCCLDTGNNMSLLDDPMEVVERLAPFAISTHLKDMALEEYPDGFLLAEIPFGKGILDLDRILKVIRAARPKTKITLEMITRDPLKVPVLTEKYWATFPERSGQRLAAMMRTVRAAANEKPIQKLSGLPPATQWQLEEDNVKLCLAYGRERLGL